VVDTENIAKIIFENNSSPLHSIEWNLTKEQHGRPYIWFTHQTETSKVAFPITIKKKGPLKLGGVPYGIPFKGDPKSIIRELKRTLRQNGIWGLITIGYKFFNSPMLEDHFHQLPFIKHRLNTFILELEGIDEEALLTKFNSTTRKHVKRAVKEDFHIEPMNNEDYGKFYQLYLALCEKQGFPPVCSKEFLEDLVKTSLESNNPDFKVVGLKSVKDGIPHGYMIGLINGNVLVEFLRADDMAIATKGYERKLLTFKMISAAIDNNVKLYDFGGVVLDDSGKGIFNFKKGFGGELVHSSRYRFILCV